MSPNPNPPEKFHSVGLSGRPTEVTLYAGLLVPLTALRCFAHFIVSRDFLAPTGCYIKVCWAGFPFRKVCVKLKVLAAKVFIGSVFSLSSPSLVGSSSLSQYVLALLS